MGYNQRRGNSSEMKIRKEVALNFLNLLGLKLLKWPYQKGREAFVCNFFQNIVKVRNNVKIHLGSVEGNKTKLMVYL